MLAVLPGTADKLMAGLKDHSEATNPLTYARALGATRDCAPCGSAIADLWLC